MKANPIALLGCLVLATIISYLAIYGVRREPESIDVSVLNGPGLSGAEILNAAYFLSSEFPVEINFRTPKNRLDSITAMSRKTASNSPVDAITLEMREGEIRLNEEVLSEDLLRSRLATIAEASRLTESDPFILLAARDPTSGIQLTRLLGILCDSRISHIIPVHTTETANMTADSTAYSRESP